jgi:FAD/FMN-containing dehydrogenase
MTALADQLASLVGPAHVATDEAHRRLMSDDIYGRGGLAGLVVAPGSAAETQAVVRACAAAGVAILPRGGGMSYTGGYAAAEAGGVVLDLRRLNAVSVNPGDRTVTVGAGATWQDLLDGLRPHGLRTPFWGPLSGLTSTVGGGLSQNNAFFGASLYGPTAESVLSVNVVLADGSLLRTGTAASGGKPFFRHDGPDLTGVFLGDCGAFGVKTEATFRLIPAPAHEAWLSFSFADHAAWLIAMTTAARLNLASEIVGFDPNLARIRMKRASLLADAGALLKVVGAQKSLLSGLKEGAKVALAGRGFLDGADYSVHLVSEGPGPAGVEEKAAALRAALAAAGGREVENTIPKVIRASPFTPLNSILGPEGERWAPVHGIVALSDATAAFEALEAVFAARAEAFVRTGVTTGYLTTTVGQTGYLIEPVFYWPDQLYPIHEEIVEGPYLSKLPRRPANPEGAAVVAEARSAVVEAFARFGAAHFQIGRTYPLAKTRTPEALAALRALKTQFDPQGVMNPGVLGL